MRSFKTPHAARFALIPPHVIALLPHLRGSDAKVIIALASFMGPAGCWPSVATLAAVAGIPRQGSVRQSLRRLESLGVLKRHFDPGMPSTYTWIDVGRPLPCTVSVQTPEPPPPPKTVQGVCTKSDPLTEPETSDQRSEEPAPRARARKREVRESAPSPAARTDLTGFLCPDILQKLQELKVSTRDFKQACKSGKMAPPLMLAMILDKARYKKILNPVGAAITSARKNDLPTDPSVEQVRLLLGEKSPPSPRPRKKPVQEEDANRWAEQQAKARVHELEKRLAQIGTIPEKKSCGQPLAATPR